MALQDFIIAAQIVWTRVFEIVKEPLVQMQQGNIEMLWILIPLLVALFLMEFYFGIYTKEKLGWNSAVSNSLILFFVGINLCSFLYAQKMLIGFTTVDPAIFGIAIKKSIITFFIVVESILLITLNFFHLVSERFAFGISSTMIMNFLGAIAIVLVYSNIPLDIITIPATLIIFVAMAIFFWMIHFLEPKVEAEEESEEEEIEEEE